MAESYLVELLEVNDTMTGSISSWFVQILNSTFSFSFSLKSEPRQSKNFNTYNGLLVSKQVQFYRTELMSCDVRAPDHSTT